MSKVKVGALIHVIPSQCQLGEGVLWHAKENAVFWIDIEGALLFRFEVTTQTLEKFSLPFRIGCFAFTPQSNEIIAAFAHGIARYNYRDQTLTWLCKPALAKGNRFNDGKTDLQGRFWAGTLIEQRHCDEQQANLYCLDHQAHLHEHIGHLHISNGLCWNNAGDKLFHADSPEHKIFQYDFCQITGRLSNKVVFATTNKYSFPDGATVDSEDYLWSAQWGSSQVVRYDTNGKLDLTLTLPVTQPSCVTIGGPNMDWLFITSAKQDLSPEALLNQPLAGDLFIYQLEGVTGIAEPICTI